MTHNQENLYSCLRADWIKTYDLSYVEDELIAGVEAFIPEAERYQIVLQDRAQGVAAALAAKAAALKEGKAGVGEVVKRKVTEPQSPKLTRPRPPRFAEPIVIEQKVLLPLPPLPNVPLSHHKPYRSS